MSTLYECGRIRMHPEGYALDVFKRLQDENGDTTESFKVATTYGASRDECSDRADTLVRVLSDMDIGSRYRR